MVRKQCANEEECMDTTATVGSRGLKLLVRSSPLRFPSHDRIQTQPDAQLLKYEMPTPTS